MKVVVLSFLAHVRALIIPGTTLVLTDAPVSPQTHSERVFQRPNDRLAVS